MNAVYFLGRFHVLVLHLPIALALTVVLAEWLARKDRYKHLTAATPFLWAATAVSAIATAALGYMHFAEGGFTGPSAAAHRGFGTSVAVLAVAAWGWQFNWRASFRRAVPAVSAVLMVLIVLTGHYGGNLTHGDTYLVEFAPGPLRRLAGLEDSRPPVTDLAMADPYLDIVRPILSQRCLSCHNDDKQRGGLNLASYDAILKGGDSGPSIVAGDPEASDLIRRISLPGEDEDAMPAEGKTPLTGAQTEILRWWVAAGATTGTALGAAIPDSIRPLLVASLGTAGEASGSPVPASLQEPDKALVTTLLEAGFLVRPLHHGSANLVVSALAPGSRFSAEQLAKLGTAAPAIVELNLSRSNLDDTALEAIGKLSALTHLRLDNNQLSDAGVKRLAVLEQLTYLNLHGNQPITDAAVDDLAKLANLGELYVWNTGITARGAARLQQLRPGLRIDRGDALAPPRQLASRR